jgi:hypothetical protein
MQSVGFLDRWLAVIHVDHDPCIKQHECMQSVGFLDRWLAVIHVDHDACMIGHERMQSQQTRQDTDRRQDTDKGDKTQTGGKTRHRRPALSTTLKVYRIRMPQVLHAQTASAK